MSNVNPYAAPQVYGNDATAPAPLSASNFAGIWRQGGVLVMHKNAPLPEICLRSNEPAKGRLMRKLQWHHPMIALTILISPLIYIIIALIMTKKAAINIALSDEWLARRKSRILIAWGIAGIGLLLFVLSIGLMIATEQGEYGLLMLPAIFVLIGAAIYAQYACRMVWPNRITDEYVWLKGVHPEFLNRLEVFPYQV